MQAAGGRLVPDPKDWPPIKRWAVAGKLKSKTGWSGTKSNVRISYYQMYKDGLVVKWHYGKSKNDFNFGLLNGFSVRCVKGDARPPEPYVFPVSIDDDDDEEDAANEDFDTASDPPSSSQASAGASARPRATLSWESGKTTVTLSRDGTLTVSGKGEMGDYYGRHDPSPPWDDIRDSITRVVIGAGVTSISRIDYYRNLKSIKVAAGNASYSSENGVLFNRNKTELIQYPQGKRGAYTIPHSVIRIWDNAFRHSGGLTSVTIPGSVKSIGKFAFTNCHGLTSVTIKEGVREIKEKAFAYCTGLTSLFALGPKPPIAGSRAFRGIDFNNACLYVPTGGNIAAYRAGRGIVPMNPPPRVKITAVTVFFKKIIFR